MEQDLFNGLHHASANFNPRRLKLIRMACQPGGKTQRALAHEVDVSGALISQYEGGSKTPSPDVLERLAKALKVHPSFFAVEEPIPALATAQHFRASAAQIAKRDQESVVATATLLKLVYDHVERHVCCDSEGLLPVRSNVKTLEDVERFAEELRDEWTLGVAPLPNAIALLENKGILVLEVRARNAKIDGFSTWADEKPVLVLITNKESASRRRFDVCHELGHLLLHRDTHSRLGDWSETQANRFAGAFLFPRAAFRAEVPDKIDLDHIVELKRRWGVSIEMILRRGVELGHFTERQRRRGYELLSDKGWRRAEPGEPEMESSSVISTGVDRMRERGLEPLETLSRELHLTRGLLSSWLMPFDPTEGLPLFRGRNDSS